MCRLSDAFGLQGFHFEGSTSLVDLEVSRYTRSSNNKKTRWIEQPFDHFKPEDNRT